MKLFYGILCDDYIRVGDDFAVMLGNKIVGLGYCKNPDGRGDYYLPSLSVRYDGKEAVEKALKKKKDLYAKVKDYEIHPTGLPTGEIQLNIDVTSLLNMVEDAKKGRELPSLDTNDLVEVNLNLTFAAKIVEKVKGPQNLVDWLNNVNRKCVALINKQAKDGTPV